MDKAHEPDSGQPLEDQPVETTIEVVGAALSAVPYAGGPLSAIATAIIRRRQNRRLNQFLIELSEDVRRLRDRLNREFMRKEECRDLFEDVVTKAAETRQKAKLDAFRAIFLNTLLAASPNYDEATEIAALIDSFQERHVVVVRILADPARANEELGRPIGEPGFATSIGQLLHRLLPSWNDDEIDRTWADLFDRKIHNTPGTKAMMTDTGIHRLENRLTPFGRRVAHYLTLPT